MWPVLYTPIKYPHFFGIENCPDSSMADLLWDGFQYLLHLLICKTNDASLTALHHFVHQLGDKSLHQLYHGKPRDLNFTYININ